MIQIKKNPEPRKWLEYRSTPGVDYQSIPELVDSLLEEQGYICAYCMRRIPCKDRLYKRDGKTFVHTNEDHRIEHMLSRENHDDKKLDYSNIDTVVVRNTKTFSSQLLASELNPSNSVARLKFCEGFYSCAVDLTVSCVDTAADIAPLMCCQRLAVNEALPMNRRSR